jgi:hypothetical protein
VQRVSVAELAAIAAAGSPATLKKKFFNLKFISLDFEFTAFIFMIIQTI